MLFVPHKEEAASIQGKAKRKKQNIQRALNLYPLHGLTSQQFNEH